MKRYMLAMLVSALPLAGCGDKYGNEARLYTEKAQESLMAQGICKDIQDCRNKENAFYEGATPWGEQTHLNLYGINDPQVVENVASALREERKKLGPGVIIAAYSSKHGQPKRELKRIEIE